MSITEPIPNTNDLEVAMIAAALSIVNITAFTQDEQSVDGRLAAFDKAYKAINETVNNAKKVRNQAVKYIP